MLCQVLDIVMLDEAQLQHGTTVRQMDPGWLDKAYDSSSLGLAENVNHF